MNFFSKTYKHKKIFAFLLLLLVISAIILPKIVLAQTGDDPFPGEEIVPATTEAPADTCQNNLSWYKSIVAGIADILLWGPKELADWITGLSAGVISIVSTWPITNINAGSGGAASAFVNGWSSVRDLANMLVVLGFVIVGIATALRIREYEAKKFLWPLIIVALLINFSGLFCGLIIDGSNITMKGLLNGLNKSAATPAQMGNTFFDDVQKTEKKAACTALGDNDLGAYVSIDVLYGVIYLAIAFCFLYLSIILIARYAILGILFMLSPLAFVFWAFPFPKAKDVWNQWWSHFLKWAFIGVSICFFLWLAGMMLQSFPKLDGSKGEVPLSRIILYLSIVIITIIVGIKISSKSSGIGALAAGAVMGLATGGAALAMGAVRGGAGLAGAGAGAIAKAIPTGGGQSLADRASSAKQKVTGGVGRAMDRMTGNTGNTAMKESARVSAEQKGMDAMLNSGNASDKARVQQLARTGTGAKGAAAVAAVVAAGQVSETFGTRNPNTGKMEMDVSQSSKVGQRLKYAGSMGGGNLVEKAGKEDPRLMAFHDEKVNKKIAESGRDENGLRVAPMSRKAAQEAVIGDAVQKMSPGEFAKNVSLSAYTPEVTRHMTTDQVTQGVYGRYGSPAKRAAFAKTLGGLKGVDDRKYKDFTHAINEAQAGGITPPPVASKTPPPPPGATPPPPPTAPSTGANQYHAQPPVGISRPTYWQPPAQDKSGLWKPSSAPKAKAKPKQYHEEPPPQAKNPTYWQQPAAPKVEKTDAEKRAEEQKQIEDEKKPRIIDRRKR